MNEENGRFLEYLSDRNPRKGISLVQNFLSSAHIQANRAIQNYINGDATFIFPYHEVFKGCMLSQWKYYKEKHSEAVNIFESDLLSRRAQLVRLIILNYLYIHSRSEKSVLVEKSSIVRLISHLGVSEAKTNEVLEFLMKKSFILTNNEKIDNPEYSLSLTGGYYLNHLCKRIVYIESVMYDTTIYENDSYTFLTNQTQAIAQEYNKTDRLILRKERIETFMDYLSKVEEDCIGENRVLESLKVVGSIKDAVMKECDNAIHKSYRYS